MFLNLINPPGGYFVVVVHEVSYLWGFFWLVGWVWVVFLFVSLVGFGGVLGGLERGTSIVSYRSMNYLCHLSG